LVVASFRFVSAVDRNLPQASLMPNRIPEMWMISLLALCYSRWLTMLAPNAHVRGVVRKDDAADIVVCFAQRPRPHRGT
jgi:hypothetical protein